MLEPLPSSQFWIGRYAGSLQLGSVWVTPLSVQIDGLPESVAPHAYATTIALGALHIVQYPVDLVHEAGRGRYYWFMVGCACDIAYLIHTEQDGAHARAADSAERVEEMYESLDGPEFVIQSGEAQFFVKRDESVLS